MRRPVRVVGARAALLPYDARWLELGLTALLASIRRIASDGPIEVHVAPATHGVRTTISFSPTTQGSIIEPLELLEQTSNARRARRLGGLGLGLDVARSIEEREADFVRLVIDLRDD
jgi:hypothetical protein